MLVAAGAETASHSREVERLALRVADRLGLSGHEREAVRVAARLHDIGKVAIPRPLLEKAGPLTEKEWELIHTHTVVGERILRSVAELRPVAGLVRHSHERWDGAGYPDGLEGDQIPRASRIIFCADAFHAICSDRPYREGRSVAAALAEIRRCAGTQFEPKVVEALTDVVRTRLYGARRVRRRSHARLSVLMASALMLGGSIAGGIAASRDVPRLPDQGSLSPTTGAPLPIPGGLQVAPQPTPRGSVAGGFTNATLEEATSLDPWQTGGGPKQLAPAQPTGPTKRPRPIDPGTRITPPLGAPTVTVPSIRPASGIDSRLGISVNLPSDEGSENGSTGGDQGSEQAPGFPSPGSGDDPSLSPPLG